MKALRFAIRSLGRELRSGEVLVLLSAVILAVADDIECFRRQVVAQHVTSVVGRP